MVTDLASPREALIASLRARYPGRVSTTPPDRVAYARDQWPRKLLDVADGEPARQCPDGIVWPTTTEEVSEIVRGAADARMPIVPFGAGSGVCGGTTPTHGGLVLDVKRMRRMIALDETARTATFEAGVVGEHLEHQLNRRGYTMGHFPSSIMCSTFGGWLATRSAGQLSTRYGKIEDMVRSLELVDGRGEVHVLEGDTDPELLQLVVGSEGTLGVITRATCTIHPLPAARHYRGWGFPSVRAGCDAIRRVLQRGLRPCVVRLYDELDSYIHRQREGATHHDPTPAGPRGQRPQIEALKRWGTGLLFSFPGALNKLSSSALSFTGRGCLLILGFEGDSALCEAEANAARDELTACGGRDLGEGPGMRWLEKRYDISFRLSKMYDAGVFVDTMEVATTWDRLMELYRAVRAAISPLAFIMAHFSHAYAEGCSIYFTFAARCADADHARARYDAIWRAGLAAVSSVGATISHHHGVGLSRAPYMPAEHGDAMRIYRALKSVLDPVGIMNPGKMGL